MSDEKAITYNIQHDMASGAISQQRVVFNDQAQANIACERLAQLLDSGQSMFVVIETRFGLAVVQIGTGFIGMFPLNTNPPVESKNASPVKKTEPADDVCDEDMTPEECDERKEQQRRWDYEAGGRAN